MTHQKQREQKIRLIQLIRRLYNFEELVATIVAEAYALSPRTITRDMHLIAEQIPLHNERGKWSLDIQALDRDTSDLSHTLLHSFAHNVQIDASCLHNNSLKASRIEFAINYANLPKILGEKILDGIDQERRCSFLYIKPSTTTQRVADPIRLYTQEESWYLIARDYKDDKVKTFLLQKIEQFEILDTSTTLTEDMKREADKIINNIWHSSNSSVALVKLYIKPHIAYYIERKKLHTTQLIVDRHYDGGLEIHCSITNKLEILPAIKSWLPHIYILEPRWLRDSLEKDLLVYKQESLNMDI